MKHPTEAELQRLSQAWRKNTQPKFATQFDAYLPLFDDRGKPMTTIAKITWNSLRDHYEMEPVIESHAGQYSLTELVISAENLEKLITLLGNLGVHTLLRVRVLGRTIRSAPSRLPRTCFPTIIRT